MKLKIVNNPATGHRILSILKRKLFQEKIDNKKGLWLSLQCKERSNGMSELLAKVFGLYFLAFAVLAIVHPKRLREICAQAIQDNGFLLYGAIFALFIGSFIIAVHNIWSFQWFLIITLLGWWSLIKGYLLLIFPESIRYFSFVQKRSDSFYRIMGGGWLLLAAFLLYHACQG